MNKYLTLAGLAFQKQLEVRSDFLFERVRSLSVMISLYFLWSALTANGNTVMGYEREQLLTYVLMAALLRAVVLGCVTDYIPQEIARGKLSDVLLRPISHAGYWAAQDVSSKAVNLIAVTIELSVFMMIMSSPFYVPQQALVWGGFLLAVLGGMIMYFQMSYLLGVMGFWTAQSWGPRFCFEILLEFTGGAYFPIDFLPAFLQKIISLSPFPYLVFYPLSIYLGRLAPGDVGRCLLIQWIWIAILAGLVHIFWKKGLRHYASEGR